MKKILITGQNSYIGNQFEEWVSQWPDDYQITKISVRNDDWKNQNWNTYDVVLNVAGIAHNSSDASLENLYYQVNRDLTIELAKKAKLDNVKHFIHMSSIIVYGGSKLEDGLINKDTKPIPANFYGDSKLQGELGIVPLKDHNYKISIIRPPMVYGKYSKGNFPLIVKVAKKTPLFPDYINHRSMIYEKNLCEFICQIIKFNEGGVFFPQNKEFICTTKLVKEISKEYGKNVHLTKIFNPLIKKISLKNVLINKIFGNLCYEKSMSVYSFDYQLFNFEDSIKGSF